MKLFVFLFLLVLMVDLRAQGTAEFRLGAQWLGNMTNYEAYWTLLNNDEVRAQGEFAGRGAQIELGYGKNNWLSGVLYSYANERESPLPVELKSIMFYALRDFWVNQFLAISPQIAAGPQFALYGELDDWGDQMRGVAGLQGRYKLGLTFELTEHILLNTAYQYSNNIYRMFKSDAAVLGNFNLIKSHEITLGIQLRYRHTK
ncbi:MAG: hypothetical protein JXQ90_01855 [Cyclobacteriaceae bacterium]